MVRQENLQIHWESYVYEIFRPMPETETRKRQRELALSMPPGLWITAKQATELNPRLARFYARAGERTPARDLNDLYKMDLVDKDKRRYRVRRNIIEAFIPPTWEVPVKPTLTEALS